MALFLLTTELKDVIVLALLIAHPILLFARPVHILRPEKWPLTQAFLLELFRPSCQNLFP